MVLLPGKSLLLPTEVLDLILRLLPRPALQAAALVCRRWREAAETPGLWDWLRLTATRKNLSSLPRLLDTRRMQGVRKLSLGALSRRLLEAVERHRGLRSLDISCRKMAPVEPELLARAVCSVQEVKVDKLTDHQVRAVLVRGGVVMCYLREVLEFSFGGSRADYMAKMGPKLLIYRGLSLKNESALGN